VAAEGHHSPLEQFEVKTLIPIDLGGVDVSFTNASLFMILAVAGILLFLTLSMQRRALVPGRWQAMAEMSYEFVAGVVRDNLGPEGKKFFPFAFTLFMFIFFCNAIALVPYTFAVTSHLIVTAALAILVIVLVTAVGIVKHGLHFFSLFMPKGVPIYMAPLLVPLEVLSYLARPVSLALRLFANLTAGHTMLKVFAGFVVMLGIGGIAPLAVIVVLYGLETLIAFLQAYVFTVLTCIYLNDALHLH